MCGNAPLSTTQNMNRKVFLGLRVMTTEQMRKPKKTIGIVSRAVNPRDITEETVDARGGASMSDVQYAQ